MQISENNNRNFYTAKHLLIRGFVKITVWSFLFILFVLSTPYQLSAQQNNDSLYRGESHIEVISDTSTENVHSPKRAGWMSAALPGLGQGYNKKYWKIPIVYAAFGTITYFLITNQQNYVAYRNAYSARIDGDESTVDEFPKLSTDAIRLYKNHYWKNRDLSIILLAGVYTLNILDAVVDAHFYTYDISDDLSLRVTPVVAPGLGFGPQRSAYAGLSFSLSF